ncbi:hypothetical protein ACLOJK_016178 [Asimina triloba]
MGGKSTIIAHNIRVCMKKSPPKSPKELETRDGKLKLYYATLTDLIQSFEEGKNCVACVPIAVYLRSTGYGAPPSSPKAAAMAVASEASQQGSIGGSDPLEMTLLTMPSYSDNPLPTTVTASPPRQCNDVVIPLAGRSTIEDTLLDNPSCPPCCWRRAHLRSTARRDELASSIVDKRTSITIRSSPFSNLDATITQSRFLWSTSLVSIQVWINGKATSSNFFFKHIRPSNLVEPICFVDGDNRLPPAPICSVHHLADVNPILQPSIPMTVDRQSYRPPAHDAVRTLPPSFSIHAARVIHPQHVDKVSIGVARS